MLLGLPFVAAPAFAFAGLSFALASCAAVVAAETAASVVEAWRLAPVQIYTVGAAAFVGARHHFAAAVPGPPLTFSRAAHEQPLVLFDSPPRRRQLLPAASVALARPAAGSVL